MRNAVLQLAEQRSEAERRRVLRIAVRQLERADLYLAAVLSLDLGDEDSEGGIEQIRDDVEMLRRHLVDERARLAVET